MHWGSARPEVLKQCAGVLKNWCGHMPVRIIPEPNNPYDTKAICFQCNVSGEWERIGYVVREALGAVHSAISILAVKFSWVKYIVYLRNSPWLVCWNTNHKER